MKNILLTLLATMAIGSVAAQIEPTPVTDNTIYRTYSTQQWTAQMRQQPEVVEQMSANERYNYQFKTFGVIEAVTVPVVVHLMPLPADASPITVEDVLAQVERLNQDFTAPRHPYLADNYQHPLITEAGQLDVPTDVIGNEYIGGEPGSGRSKLIEADIKERFMQRAGNPQIRFCLAEVAPDGSTTNGVVPQTSSTLTWSMEQPPMLSEEGSASAWETKRYLNIWIGRLEDKAGAGWAQMPGGPEKTDGIVIDDRFWLRASAGNTPNVTLSHLMGSYLNLYELWNDAQPCSDDYVDDTPIHNASNYGLTDYSYRHVSTCDGNPVEMLSNIMDNADDLIQYMFTWGQIMRMQATVSAEGPRGGLRKSQELTQCSDEGLVEEGDDRSNPSGKTIQADWGQVRAFPNPTAGDFTVEISLTEPRANDGVEVSVFNSIGDLIWNNRSQSEQYTTVRVPAATWQSGIYSIQVRVGQQQKTMRIEVVH
jgi:hypothetical protein